MAGVRGRRSLRHFGDADAEHLFPGLAPLVAVYGDIDARAMASIPIDGSDAIIRVGRYGPYLERGETRANIPTDLAPDEMTAEKAEELFNAPSGERELGIDPETGRVIMAKSGRAVAQSLSSACLCIVGLMATPAVLAGDCYNNANAHPWCWRFRAYGDGSHGALLH